MIMSNNSGKSRMTKIFFKIWINLNKIVLDILIE